MFLQSLAGSTICFMRTRGIPITVAGNSASWSTVVQRRFRVKQCQAERLVVLTHPKSGINLGKLQRPHCSPSLEIIVNKGNHPQIALIQVSELL